ncbi:MAG TPA: phage/plasmid primase, P4 family [Gemmataceae bacterium]
MIQESAANYMQRGYGVCRIRPGEKRPTYKKWNLRSLSAEDFHEGDNLGLLTGHLSGDLVCVDLDSPEALRLADEFLAPTSMVDGRPNKPRSHRWYRVVEIPPELTSSKASGGMGGPKTKHFRHAENGQNILDFLGTGGQAVVPPSLHGSGERRVWDEDGEPAILPMMELWEAVCRLAAACGWKKEKVRLQNRHAIQEAKRFIRQARLARTGHGGHDTTFYVASVLRNDLSLPGPIGRRLLDQYNKRLAKAGLETWTKAELDHKWESAGGDCPRECQPAPALQKPANDPHRLASEFINKTPWVYWHGLYFEFDGAKYVEVPDYDIRARLNGHVQRRLDADFQRQLQEDSQRSDHFPRRAMRPPTPLSATSSLTRNTLQALEGLALQANTVRMPSYLPSGETPKWLSLSNGLLDLDAEELLPHSPDWFSTVCLPYPYDSQARCDRWLAMLQQNLERDTERISLLQEYFGYCLIPSTDAQACLILVGEGGNGKSVVLAGLHALLGDGNVSTVPLEDFGKRFAMAQTLGKLANISAEIGELDRTAEGTLKAFVSGDPMTFERKGKDAFAARPTARLVLSTNNIPRFADRSEGVWRRLKLVPFNRRVPEAERVPGMDKPEWWLRTGEVAGILNWALEGLRRLLANNMQFTQSAACRTAIEAHRLESDPCRAFLLENYVAEKDAKPIAVDEVYRHYQGWCEEGGHRTPLSKQKFGREVRRVFRLEDSHTHRFGSTSVQRAWSGLSRKL